MFCSNCGSKLVDGAKFCSECGARVVKPEEPETRSFAEVGFEEPKVAEEISEAAAPVMDEAPEKPVREKVTFDWSNVVDEPHKREIGEIKSPWGATTGSIDEKQLYAEMTPSTDKSRTMSFIDILKAEKEEKERAAADKAIEYTEVLEFDPDLAAFDEAPSVHMAPLYSDFDTPVKTPFDEPESKNEPVFEDEPKFEEPEIPSVVEEPVMSEPVKEPEVQKAAEEPVIPETVEETVIPEAVEEPEEANIRLSRETIAQFDEFVKSFEKEAGIINEPEFDAPAEEPEPKETFAPKFELPDFLKKMSDFARPSVAVEPEPAANEPVFEEPAFEEPEFDEPDLLPGEPAVIELDDEDDEPFDEPELEPAAFEEVEYEEPVFDEPIFEEPAFEEPKYDEISLATGKEEEEYESMEDLYLDIDPNTPTGDYKPSFVVEETDDDDEEDDEPVEEIEEIEEDIPVDEEELFREMEESKPELPSMTIAPPADKESEIEALRRRLAELTGVMEPIAPIEEPVEEAVEEVAEPVEEAAEPIAEPAVEETVEEVVEEAVEEVAEPIEEAAEPIAEPAVEETVEEVVEEAVEEVAEPIEEAAEPVAEPVVEEAVEEAVEPATPENDGDAKQSDALSLEELEKDLFGEVLSDDAVAEETKKIDKFYTLYRKNEEFQRLLDEEYERLKHGGNLTEEEKAAVDNVPKMADVEAAKAASVGAVAAAAVAKAAVEPTAVPAEDNKAYRQIEDETIYMPKEAVEKEIKAELAAAAPAEAPADPADKKKQEKKEKKEKEKQEKKAKKQKAEAEYEEVDSGSKFLTVLAVIIAIILIMLLAVILILQIAPDSGAAAWIDSLIEGITSSFGMISPSDGQFLL